MVEGKSRANGLGGTKASLVTPCNGNLSAIDGVPGAKKAACGVGFRLAFGLWLVQVVLFVALAYGAFGGRLLSPLVEGIGGVGWAKAGSSLPYMAPLVIALCLLPLTVLLGPLLFRGLRLVGSTLPAWIVVGLLALAATIFPLVVQIVVLDRIPHVQDSLNYLWQAQVFADGLVRVPSHPLAEFFSFRFMVNTGRWYSLFQPGWPLILALGVLVGVPWAVNPVLAGLTIVGVYLVGRRLMGEGGGRLSAFILASSPFFLIVTSSMMAHPLSTCLAVWAWLAYLKGWDRLDVARQVGSQAASAPGEKSAGPIGKALLFFALSGALLGYLFVVRALDALLFSLPLALHALALACTLLGWRRDPVRQRGDDGDGKSSWRVLLWRLIACGAAALTMALVVGSIQFGYNAIQTGHPLVWPQDIYFQITEPVADCHRLGFGSTVGCPREHGPDLVLGGFTPRRAVQVTNIRLASLEVRWWGSGLGLLLAIAGFLVPLVQFGRRRTVPVGGALAAASTAQSTDAVEQSDGKSGAQEGAKDVATHAAVGRNHATPIEPLFQGPNRGVHLVLLWVLALGPVVGYFFYYYHGNCYGPRYYFAALPAMAMMAASILQYLWGLLAPNSGGARSSLCLWSKRSGAGLLLALFGGIWFHSTLYGVPAYWREISGMYGYGYWGVDRRVESLVEDQGISNAVILIGGREDPDTHDSSYRIGFVHMHHRPDDADVVMVRDHGPQNEQLFRYYRGRSFYRFIPRSGQGQRGSLIPVRPDEGSPNRIHAEGESKFPVESQYGHARPVPLEGVRRSRASWGHALEFTATQVGASFTMRQYVFEEGQYQLEAALLTGPDMAVAGFSLAGIPLEGFFDGYSQFSWPAQWRSPTRVRLAPGVHEVGVFAKEQGKAGGLRVTLDYFRLIRVDE